MKTTNTQDISRRDAAHIIDALLQSLDTWTREGAAVSADREEILSQLFDLVNGYGLQVPRPCNGEAHSNPYVDNCGVCMPHWAPSTGP